MSGNRVDYLKGKWNDQDGFRKTCDQCFPYRSARWRKLIDRRLAQYEAGMCVYWYSYPTNQQRLAKKLSRV
jgi:hypothetical protein